MGNLGQIDEIVRIVGALNDSIPKIGQVTLCELANIMCAMDFIMCLFQLCRQRNPICANSVNNQYMSGHGVLDLLTC